ncbi:MAG: heat-inducible transcriptional repressor HrcA [Actinomycetota bacterium]
MADQTSLDDRKSAILRAIVSHYVRSGEPAGSRTIAERFRLGVSPATVRNEMGALEEAGYIFQPHTSAGRVPTDLGYRYFVDSWASGDARLPAQDLQKVRRFFTQPRWELEDALRETAALLSTLTTHAAVVFTPTLDKSLVRRVELVPLSGDRAMLLLVTDTGRVENHVVPTSIDDVQLGQATDMLNRVVDEAPIEQVAQRISSSIERFPLELRDVAGQVGRTLDEEVSKRDTERIYLEGTSNIVDEEKFTDLETVRQVIGALEHRRLMLELLADALASTKVSVRIGSENSVEEMQLCSVITASYGSEDQPLGSLGIVGPTRMDYRRTIAAVHEVAGALGRMLGELGV